MCSDNLVKLGPLTLIDFEGGLAVEIQPSIHTLDHHVVIRLVSPNEFAEDLGPDMEDVDDLVELGQLE